MITVSSTSTYNERIDPWLQVLWDQHGSDLLLVSGSAPRVRVDGELRPLENVPPLTGSEIADLVGQMLSPDQVAILKEQQDVDFSLTWQDKARLRGSAFRQRGELALALRMIPSEIPSFEELGLPPIAEWLARLPRGLVLMTGPTGSGKSTTLASIIRADQRDPCAPHPHDRGPRRVRARAQPFRGEPARDRPRQPFVRAGSALCAAGGPRCSARG